MREMRGRGRGRGQKAIVGPTGNAIGSPAIRAPCNVQAQTIVTSNQKEK